MNVVRSLERRLEKLLTGVTGRVFSGRLHPAEVAGKLAREADFARFDHPSGPATANYFVILVNPKNLTIDPTTLERQLEAELDTYTIEEGLRLEGPIEVSITSSESVHPGKVICHVEVKPGPPVPWGILVGEEELVIGRNRTTLGRADDCDVVIPHQDVSRSHAVVVRGSASSAIIDLDSSNGTYVDGRRVEKEPATIEEGSVVRLGTHDYSFREL